MTAGHLQEKKGYFYAVLSYKDEQGKRKTKWISTGLVVKGNKKRAEEFLMEQRMNFDPPKQTKDYELFADFLLRWLEIVKPSIAPTTHTSYIGLIRNPIEPWFREKGIKLKNLKPADLQDFYAEQGKRVSPNTVLHYHAVLHRALRCAERLELIKSNPASKVERPRKKHFSASFYSDDELMQLFREVENTEIAIPVKMAAFFGLRRSEVLGLRWDAIDFERNTICIKHTVTTCRIDGKYTTVAADTTKNRSSRRTLPMVQPMREMLLSWREQTERYKELCGNCWKGEDNGYLCVNALGECLTPGALTKRFERLLEQTGMRPIRFHDLRHSCASLLLRHGIPLKQIQDWLGHSDFSTTANIYAHLDTNTKQQSAQALEGALKLA